MKIKLMYVVPHLSTGGMPQFVLKRIEYLKKFNDKIETIDCFLHDGKYHTEINKHILDEYIIEKKNKIYGKQTL